MDYLVTGATGFVGNNLVRRLLNRGHTVRVMARKTSDSRPLADLNVDRVIGDICEPSDVKLATDQVDCVIHAAANVAIGRRGLDVSRKVNVDGTRQMAQAAADRGARFIFVSSVDALAPSHRKQPVTEETPYERKVDCSYVVTKREAELAVLDLVKQGLRATIVNPGFMLGPFDWKPSSGRMLLSVAKSFTPFAPPGGMSGCDVRDVVDAIANASISENAVPGRSYILAGHNIKFWKAWRIFAKVSNSSGPISPFGPVVARVVGAIGDAKTMLSGEETELNSAMLKMSCLNHYYSSERATRELGYTLRPFEESAADAWHWFRENGYA